MSKMIRLFPSVLYYQKLGLKAGGLKQELLRAIYKLKEWDVEGRRWSKENYKGGYTSYGSQSEIFQMGGVFGELKNYIDLHVQKYAKALDIQLKTHPLCMTQCWVNIMPVHCRHTSHLHPLSTISGTYYVSTPKGSGGIQFEDPRLECFMASAPRHAKARLENQRYFKLEPQEGQLLLFESWMRHEVKASADTLLRDRVSISFNYHY